MALLKYFANSHLGLAAIALGPIFCLGGCSMQTHFDDPGRAVGALVQAFRSGDQDQLRQILGPDGKELLVSGDPISDQTNAQRFLSAYDQKHQLVNMDDNSVRLEVGDDDWPMPIPVVKDIFNQWRFDTDAGKDEILNRRIGRNELSTMQVCLAIVDAQREYAERDPENVGVPVYAEKLFSDPGRKNGLFWETAGNEPPSPMGALVGEAAAEGYARSEGQTAGPRPYHGYFFKLLTSQGPYAKGGARNYVVNGRLLGGFAVVAWPANYGISGIMTFIVNQDGSVYQRDFGKDPPPPPGAVAPVTAFNPDPQWTKVEPGDPSDIATTAKD